MKRFFFLLSLLISFSIGQMWATESVYKQTIFSADNQPGNGTYTGTFVNTTNNFAVTVGNGNNNSNGWSGHVKMGRKNNASVGYITTNAAIDKAITKVTLTIDAVTSSSINSIKLYTSSNGSTWTEASSFTVATGAQDAAIASNKQATNMYYKIEVDCKSASKNGIIELSQVDYYAEASSGDTPTPTLSVAPATIDFGTVEQNAVVDDKTVAVTFANLTGSVTYSGLTSQFTASGTISATGDEITIAANTSTVGEYEQTLTVTSAADSKSATVTVTMNVVEPFNGLQLTFPDYNDKGVGSYSASWTATKNGQTWDIVNFNNNSSSWDLIKAGSKNAASVASITTQVANAVESIVVTIGSVTAANVNSHKLYVADNADFTSAIEVEGDPATIAAGDITYTIPAANRANDLYYKLEYDLAQGSANGFLTISKLTYAYGTAAPQKQSTGLAYADANHLAKAGASYTAPTLTNPNSLEGIAYASSDANVVAVDASTGTLTIKAAGKAVITASRAEDDTYKPGSASYTIYVATEAGTAEDPLTETSAKALIDLGCGMNAHVAGVITGTPSYNSTYHNYTVTLPNGFQFFRLKDLNNQDFSSGYLKAGDELVAVGTLTIYNGTYELAEGCYLTSYTEYTEPLVDISNTKETAYTVAEALALAVNPSSDLTKAVYIKGVVYDVKSFNSTNGTLDIYIKDEGVDNKFEFFKCKGIYDESLTAFTAADDVQVGDEVIGYGVMKYYSGGSIWEFDNTATGDYLVELTRPDVAVESVTLPATESVEVGKTVTLSATISPDNASDKSITWSVQSGSDKASVADGVVTGIAEGTAVIRATSNADNTKYAECTVTVTAAAPLSPYASVYTTRDVTISSNSNVKVTIDGTNYDAVKANKGATATITLPEGSTKIHLHLVAWKGEAHTVTVSGECFNAAKNLDISANDGVSGSGTTYDLGESGVDYYFSLTPDNAIAADEVITITAANNKRFVLFGVNQEGGSVAASIEANPTSLAFGSVEQGAEVEAKTINVTLTEVAAATVALSGEGASAFSIDKAALSESGTITVTPNTTTVGSYAATITISDNASEADPVEVAISMTVTEPAQHDDLSGTWVQVTNPAQLVAGKQVIIASIPDEEGAAVTMSTNQATNNRTGVTGATVSDGVISAKNGTAVFTIEAGALDNTIAFKSSANQYLYAASSSKNYLRSQDTNDANGIWTVSFDVDGVATLTAQGSNTHNVMRYNPNSGSPIFACYSSETGTLVTLYIKQDEPDPQPEELVYTEVRSGLEPGRFYTICMGTEILAIRGASFWGISKRDQSGSVAYLEEENVPYAAGKPFLFYATSDKLEVAYGTETTTTAGTNGALHGTLDGINTATLTGLQNEALVCADLVGSDKGIYMMYNNAFHPLGTNNYLAANRAYLVYCELEAVSTDPQSTPGRQVRKMPLQGNVATGIEEGTNADNTIARKVMIDGQLFILRGEKMYDATGAFVK